MATKQEETIASYVTDMLALEEHIETALSGQIEDLEKEEPDFVMRLREVRAMCRQHIQALEALSTRREQTGQGIAKTVKRAASAVLGVGAAAIDFVRTETLPKNIRDDYAAISLASIGYVMLYTTAMTLGDNEVAEIAYAHLQGHAQSTMTLHNLAPAAVVRFLQQEGHATQNDALQEIEQKVQRVWTSHDERARDEANV